MKITQEIFIPLPAESFRPAVFVHSQTNMVEIVKGLASFLALVAFVDTVADLFPEWFIRSVEQSHFHGSRARALD